MRAKPEKRNQLLSFWARSPRSATTPDVDVDAFYVDEHGDDGDRAPRDVAPPPTPSSFGLLRFHSSLRRYATVALFDVYANYATIMAFKYTTITNVSLFDALAIPSAIVCSSALFGRRYTRTHLLGVLACGVGVMLNVLRDWREDARLMELGDDEESAQERLVEHGESSARSPGRAFFDRPAAARLRRAVFRREHRPLPRPFLTPARVVSFRSSRKKTTPTK